MNDALPANAAVEVSRLHFKRGERTIFNDVSLTIPKGKITAIMGPSGTGKTTLLRLIGAQLAPDAGQVIVDGQNVHQLSHHDLFELRRGIGMLFQSGALFSDLSVFENVAFPLREHTNLSNELIEIIVMMKLEAVGLRGALSLMPSELSGGMSRRVALARAIALDPKLMMYDEPFAGQDPISMGVLVKLIRLLNDALNITSIIVSHDVPETVSIADYIYIVADGSIVGHGTPTELMNSQAPWVKQFLHALPDGPVPFHYPSVKFKQALLREGS